MFIAMSRFVVANGMENEVHQAFQHRPHRVDQAAGFLRMEVLRPVQKPNEFWLLTWWMDQVSYNEWHKSHAYHDSHSGIPKGLKLVQGETKIVFFERIAN